MGRPAESLVDLNALRHNYRLLKGLHGGRCLAVIKADAYGHGAVQCARALQQGDSPADGFAVAFLDEAVVLRRAGILAPILVLEGAFDMDELALMVQLQIWTVVHQQSQIEMLRALPAGCRLNIWLKVDTGMNRAGFSPSDVRAAWTAAQESGRVESIVLMSHLSRADEPLHSFTADQVMRFDESTHGLPGERSLANSAGILAWPGARRDWGRLGIALYGSNPLAECSPVGLKPVMALKSQVFATRLVRAGDSVGYGGAWTAEVDSRIGLVAMGYADGYPRAASGAPVCVDGHMTSLVGRVSMDMMMLDLTHLPDCGQGSDVELWGAHVSVESVATVANTISYELLCGVKRVARRYLEQMA